MQCITTDRRGKAVTVDRVALLFVGNLAGVDHVLRQIAKPQIEIL
jgi:hypothetical protein